ncbi:MAG: polymerase subunit delta, partial [Mesotoga sp.]|nr:polymerase subunit delta [Mesotoga sp.]
MQWFDGVVNDKLSRLLARSSGTSITLVGRDSEYLKVLATSIVESDPKWSKRRYVEDFLLIEPENGNIGIDRIRDIEEIMLHRPSGDGKKYVLIHQCERMTDESANAFLKILEEPPSFATLIMTTTSWQSLLPTIRSRTVSMRGEVPRELMDELRAKYGKR